MTKAELAELLSELPDDAVMDVRVGGDDYRVTGAECTVAYGISWITLSIEADPYPPL